MTHFNIWNDESYFSIERTGAAVIASTVTVRRTLRSLFLQQCALLGSAVAYAVLADDLSIANEITFAELEKRVLPLAAALAARCVPGDRIVLAFDNGAESIELFWACLVAGLVPIPAPAPAPRQFTEAGLKRLEGIAQNSGAALVVVAATQLAKLAGRLPRSWISRDDLETSAHPVLPDVIVSENDVAYLQYTSGSTSEPRGVELTHYNILAHYAALDREIDANGAFVSALNWLPWYHDFGLLQGVISPVYTGVTSYLMPTLTFLFRPLSWLEAISKYKISHSGAPDMAYRACVRALARKPHWSAPLDCWSLAISGGEPVRAETIETFSRAFAPHGFRVTTFAPAYGLAEAVLAVSIKSRDEAPRLLSVNAAALEQNRVDVGALQDGAVGTLVGCGKPLDGIDVRIVDPNLRVELPSHSVGEIWVSGPTSGRGYWGQAGLSQEQFRAKLATDGENGQSFLRTGDLGFFHDGEMFVSGRLKDLILVNGRNLYPQDIESTAQKSHLSVRDAAVVAFGIERQAGEAVVVLAECVGRPDPSEIDAIVESIRREVSADHGVEVYDVALLKRGTLPHTSSGKPQRAAARRQYTAGDFTGARHDSERMTRARREPQDAMEHLVAEAWMAVLDVDSEACDVDADFFLLGGNSLIATQLVSRLNAVCGVDLPIRAVFEAPTIAGLAQKLRELPMRVGSAPSPTQPWELSGKAVGNPLSFSQERFWFVSQQMPQSAAFNMPLALRLKGALDVAALAGAISSIVARHEILRTTFHGTPTGVEPIVHAEMPISVTITKPEQDPLSAELALERQFALLTQQPFDLEHGPLVRVHLFEIGADETVLLIVMHHIVGDQWSFAVLARELAHFYRVAVGEDAAPLPPLPIQYADFAAWQRHTFAGDRRVREEDYWTTQLAGMEPATIAPDYPRSHRFLHRGAHVRVPFSSELVEKLTALGARHSASLSMVMMTALNVLLERYTGRSDVSIGVSVANRNRAWSEGLIGTFVNVLLLRTDVDRELDFGTLLKRVRQTALDAFAHQEMPFDQLVQALKHQRDASRSSLFQVLFNAINAPVGKIDFENLEVSRINFDHGSSQFDLSVVVDADHDRSISFEYAIHVFQPETVSRFAQHYLKLLEDITRNCAEPISHLTSMDEVELGHVIEIGRGPDVALPADTVVDWLKPAFATWTQKQAVVFEGKELSYRGLDQASDAVASALGRRGIGRGHRVGLYIPRSIDMIVAQIGILKSGAAYVPLDPVNPAARLAYMARDANVSLILAQAPNTSDAEWMGAIPTLTLAACADHEPVCDDTSQSDFGHAGAKAGPKGDDPAYILYTSGSTGEPKGVVASHRSVVNLLSSVAREPGLSNSDRVLAITTLSFDISLVETLLPLGVGASIVLAGRSDAGDGAALLRLIDTHEVTFVQATPSTWHLLLSAGWTGSPHLKKVLVGGEPLPPSLAALLVSRCDEVWNMYGPTETTVWSTAGRIVNPDGQAISIGRPIANTRIYVLDAELRVCPVGVEGEIYIGGLGVAQGYVNLPDLNAERFLIDPFSTNDPDVRIYKTGDRGRWQNDGTLVHLGRADAQVKLRGHRIELSEIEVHLQRHPQVDRATALVRETSPGDSRLVAYVVPRGDAITAEMLRQHLARTLPDYMLPQHIAVIDALPVLSNGKVDTKRLSAVPLYSPSTRMLEAPRSPDEQAVWDIWRNAFGFENFGVHENFFELGGHSMLAVRVINRVRAEVNATGAIQMLFQHPTIAEFVAAMNGRIAIETPMVVPLQELGAQPPLFCICGINLYQELANHLAPHRQVYAVFVPCELGILNGEVDEGSFFASVEEIAADYIIEMRKKQPRGPYHLAGLSFGGVLAFEIAQQLRHQGEQVAFLAMFDTVMPMSLLQIAAWRVRRGGGRSLLGGVSALALRGAARIVRSLYSLRSPSFEAAKPADAVLAEEERQAALRDAIYRRAARSYTPRSYDGSVFFIRAQDSKIPDTSPLWGRVIEKLEVLSVPGDHLGILQAPYVGVVAEHMLARFGSNPHRRAARSA